MVQLDASTLAWVGGKWSACSWDSPKMQQVVFSRVVVTLFNVVENFKLFDNGNKLCERTNCRVQKRNALFVIYIWDTLQSNNT